MGVCRGRIERQVDALDQVEERRQAAVGGDMPVLASAPQPVRLRVDPCHAGQLQRGAPLDLDHEVGADVARADDGDAQRPAVRAHAGSGLRARRIGRGSGIRRKRSSRKGSRRSGRRPVVIISARARPDVGAQRDPLHRVAGGDVGVLEVAGAVEHRQPVGGDRPHAGPLRLDLGRLPRQERLPRAGHDRGDPAPVETVVDAAELHRAADAEAIAERRAADVDVDQEDGMGRNDRRLDREAVALPRLHRDGDPDRGGERRRPGARGEHDRAGLEIAGGGAHVRQPPPLLRRARTPRRLR